MGGLRRGGGLIGPPRVRPPGSRDRSVGGEREFRQPQRGGTRQCGERAALARCSASRLLRRSMRWIRSVCFHRQCVVEVDCGFSSAPGQGWERFLTQLSYGSTAAPRRKRRPVCCGSLAGRRRYWNECLNRTFLRCFRRSNRALRRRRSKTIARAGWAISWPVGTAC